MDKNRLIDEVWRVGGSVGRTLYAWPNAPSEPDKDPELLLGMVDTPELARHIAVVHNRWLREQPNPPLPDDTDMTQDEFRAASAQGQPVEVVTSREKYERRLSADDGE